MKRLLKISLFVGAALIALVLWMRSLASWRPVKLRQVNLTQSSRFWTEDGRLLLVADNTLLDMETGATTKWCDSPLDHVRFSPRSSQFGAVLDHNEAKGILRLRNVQSGQLLRTFRWPTDENHTPHVLWSNDARIVGVADKATFFLWNRQSGQLLHRTSFRYPFLPPHDYPLTYIISPDGQRITGCGVRRINVWSSQSGELINSCELGDYASHAFFAANGRALVCFSPEATDKYRVLDVSTGRSLWQTKEKINESRVNDDELFMPRSTNREVLDIFTGRVKRTIPGPRSSDPAVVHVSPDFIYTLNSQGEVVRWRAW